MRPGYASLRFLLSVLAVSGCSAFAAAPAAQQLPFVYVANAGQAPSNIRYLGNGPDYRIWFEDRGYVVQQGAARMDVQFAGAQKAAAIVSEDRAPGRVNYLHGGDPRKWQLDLPVFRALVYRDVWPGIDVRFRSEKGTSKAEYLVAPRASAESIRLRISGRSAIEPDGTLLVTSESGEYREDRPVLFQESNGTRHEVEGAFRIDDDGSVGFSVGPYDPNLPLTIDPAVVFSGYFGGNSQTTITSVAVNSIFNTVVAGWTMSTNLATTGSARVSTGGGVDAFVATFSPAGGALVFCTYLGGSSDDRALGLAVDPSNNIYVTGQTSSGNFPTVGPAQLRNGGSRDAFVTKLSADGRTLLFSTYLGGSGADVGTSIAVDSHGRAVVAGDTTSANLAVSGGAFQPHLAGFQNAFVAVLSATGNSIASLTYLGGNSTDHAAAMKLDATDAIYIGGSTYSGNFPVLNAFQPHSGGGQDGFISKMAADCRTVAFSSYLGGSSGGAGSPESVNAIAIGGAGGINVAGVTASANFPVTAGAFQTVYGGGNSDGFVARIKANGAIGASTFLGGSSDDGVNSIAVDYNGEVYVTGYTSSSDFPTLNATQSSNAGGLDAFVTKMTLSQLVYSTYLGGSGNDTANSLALDSLMSVTVAGTSSSSDFRVSGGAGSWQGAQLSSFVSKIAPRYTMAVVSQPAFLFDVWHDTGYNGANITLNGSTFGQAGDIAVAGDWDGSGWRRIGIFRNGTWILDMNGDGFIDGSDKTIVFGQAGDVPVVGDWNGTGRAKLGLFRQGTFILDLSGHLSGVATGLADASFAFGQAGDIPVVSDWNRSGTSKVGVFRAGQWLVDYNGDRVFNQLDQTYTFGQAGDLPVIGDWDGSGLPKIGVYRQGFWILDYAGVNKIQYAGQALTIGFGGPSYTPLVL